MSYLFWKKLVWLLCWKNWGEGSWEGKEVGKKLRWKQRCVEGSSWDSGKRWWAFEQGGSRLVSLVAQMVKNLPAMLETWVWFLGQENPLEKGKATHSSILAWRIPWTEEPGGPHCTGYQESGMTERLTYTHTEWCEVFWFYMYSECRSNDCYEGMKEGGGKKEKSQGCSFFWSIRRME